MLTLLGNPSCPWVNRRSFRPDRLHCYGGMVATTVCGGSLLLKTVPRSSSSMHRGQPGHILWSIAYFFYCFPQHSVFMHSHHIAHLDISLRNLLTDYNFHYACIDYETSHRFDCMSHPRLSGIRGTEMPPEAERGEPCDPYKVDIWALAVLILRACNVRFRYCRVNKDWTARQLAGRQIPELVHLTRPMLQDNPDRRPSASAVLKEFDKIVAIIHASQASM
jgi:serine/threonine protein kinase